MEFTVPSLLAKRRESAFHAQNGQCYYCGCAMLKPQFANFIATDVAQQFDRQRMCTAEHLQARTDGGTDARKNLVAACWYCNTTRHSRYGGKRPREYRAVVRRQVMAGVWPTVGERLQSVA